MRLKKIFVYPRYPDSLRKLFYFAYNLWSTWDREADRVFSVIDPALFRRVGRNPVRLLYELPESRIQELSKNEEFLRQIDSLWQRFERYGRRREEHRDLFGNGCIAYFSMEYGLHASIPLYAGGLGILSGDHLKGSSDLGFPLVGIGLFYRNGYFRQKIDPDGTQQEEYQSSNLYHMPVREYRTAGGDPLSITVQVERKSVKIKVWLVDVGTVRLFLLDTNIEENPPEIRAVTDNLYDAGRQVRLMQELVLGFGGMALLKVLGERPLVYHLNEGHSAFLVVRRMRDYITGEKMSFEEARACIVNSTVFTTHTPVEAGNENFPAEMVGAALRDELDSMGVSPEKILRYGFLHDASTFWLPAFAIRFSRYVNGVSVLHGEVSRRMWKDLFPERLEREIPIDSITNGVHYSWLSPAMRDLLAPGGGADHPAAGGQGRPLNVGDIPDGDLWEIHMRCKREMIEFVRNQLEKQYVQRGYSGVRVRKLQETLDANFLTIVFARRFAAYKRPTLILADKERLHRILSDSDRPVQLIFTGKAHPADGFGKGMIKEIIDFARDFEVEDRVIFLENYDMEVAEQLVRGADIWLNSPLKPFEASGTSGMKAGMNGVLNLSVLDGWWPECFNGENGWAVESGDMQAHRETRDAVESNQIYDLLEEEIVPLYYDRNERDLPSRWVEMMKKSMTTLLDRFTINRMLGEYMDRYYAPAVRNLQALLGDGLVTLRKSLAAADKIREVWSKVDIREIRTDIDGRGVTTTGDTVGVSCRVSLDDADPDLFGVQIFYYREREDEYAAIPLEFVERDGAKVGLFRGHFTLTSSGVQGFSVRLVPADETVRALFPELIKWQRF